MSRTVYLARHGESTWNRCRRITGQLDPPLSRRGMQQARQLSQVLRDVPLVAVYASALTRSRVTAGVVASEQGLVPRVTAELNEIHLGFLEGRWRDGRDPSARDQWAERQRDRVGYRPPGGESFRDLTLRVVAAVSRILLDRPVGPVLIVGHRNTNRAILHRLLGWSLDQAAATPVRQDVVLRIAPGQASGPIEIPLQAAGPAVPRRGD